MGVTEGNKLSNKEQFRYEHIQQAKVSNQTLTEHASAEGLSIKYFYNYRSKLRKKGFLEFSETKSFVKVIPLVNEFGATIVLPNGIRIQTQCRVEALSDLIKRLD